MRPHATRTTRTLRVLAGALAMLTGCDTMGGSSPSAPHTVTYWLWDANQLPAYQACANGFGKQNPGLKVQITQIGWNDYWTKLDASFIAGTQPDVFTDHVQHFPQYVDVKALAPLDELPLTDKIRDSAYQPGLGAAWIGPGGHRYGSPKDWDTVALFYNKKMAKDAGISESELNNLTWNPSNGGSFEKAIAHLTIDDKGVRGDQPGFDKNHVKVYGLATNDAGDADGQTQWSPFAASTGWHYTNQQAWGTHYNYDQKSFQSAIQWYFGLAKMGYLAPFKDFSQSNGPEVQMGSGKAATALHGSWMIKTFYGLKGVDVGTALTPLGPTGKRATMMNGLGDSITKHAHNLAGAEKWVAYLSSDQCQKTVGTFGIVFPASKAGTQEAIKAHRSQGIDVSAFTKPVADGTTFSYPITNYAADVYGLMRPAMENIYANGAPVTSLDQTNKQINLLLSQ